jgi:hypothetical protein
MRREDEITEMAVKETGHRGVKWIHVALNRGQCLAVMN